MLSTSKEYLQSIVSDTRDMPYRVTLGGELVLGKSQIPKMSLDENVGNSEGVAVGTANSATFRFTMKNADAIDYDGMLVEPESGLVLPDGSTEYVPLGKFWVIDYSTSNDFKTVELTCADGMYHMTSEYVSKLTYPAHIRDVTHEIVAQAGVEFSEPLEWPEVYVRRNPEGLTHREAIGHAAGCCGCNARFNRQGALEFTWYTDTGFVISRKIQYLDGLTKTNYKPLEVKFEVVGQQELYEVTAISDGNGGLTATPGSSIVEGETVVISVNPFSEYELASISAETEHGDTVTLYRNSEGGYTFVQPDSHVTVTASFRRIGATEFDLTVRAYDGGSIRTERGVYSQGEFPIIYIGVREGFEIDRIATTPADIGLSYIGTTAEDELKYEFTMPRSDVTINVYFKEQEVATYSRLAYRKTAQSDSVVITSDKVSSFADGDTIFIESEWIYVSKEDATLSINIGSTPQETDKVILTYSNPMIYDKSVDAVSALVKGVTYTPSTVKYRGNPALQAGDIVIVPDKDGIYHTVLVMQQILSFGGGMNGEIHCPGKTEGTKSFSAVSPGTTQIRKEVQKSTTELEKRLNSNNALVFNSMHSEIGRNESKIKSVVEWQTEQGSAMARIEQSVKNNEANISLVVGQNGIVNEEGKVQGSVVIEAINGESTAKIAADHIEFEGKKLDIKVDATNIEGEITADQINAQGLEVKDGNFSGVVATPKMFLQNHEITVDSDDGGSVEVVTISWRTGKLAGNYGDYYATASIEEAVSKDIKVKCGMRNPSSGGYSVQTGVIVAGKTSCVLRWNYYYDLNYYDYVATEWVTISRNGEVVTVDSSFAPSEDTQYNLGTSSRKWVDIYSSTGTINTSDEREKNSIAEIPQKYSDMFDKLNPVIYKMNNGTSGRFHVGFIAQEVEQAMTECGIDSKEFAGFIKTPVGDGYIYGLRYSEFIALAIGEIQELKKKIKELEERMNE